LNDELGVSFVLVKMNSLESLEDSQEREDEEGEGAPADERDVLVDDCGLERGTRHHSQIEKSAHAMTAAPAGSPWAVANA
jgi:hypothetical protein